MKKGDSGINEIDHKTGSFVKGMTPWNKGKRGYMGANRTSFTREKILAKAFPVGKGRHTSKGNVCMTDERVAKPDPRFADKIYMFRKRMSTARYVMMKAGHPLKRDEVVWHRDHNPDNNEISNLEVITRAELARRNKLG